MYQLTFNIVHSDKKIYKILFYSLIAISVLLMGILPCVKTYASGLALSLIASAIISGLVTYGLSMAGVSALVCVLVGMGVSLSVSMVVTALYNYLENGGSVDIINAFGNAWDSSKKKLYTNALVFTSIYDFCKDKIVGYYNKKVASNDYEIFDCMDSNELVIYDLTSPNTNNTLTKYTRGFPSFDFNGSFINKNLTNAFTENYKNNWFWYGASRKSNTFTTIASNNDNFGIELECKRGNDFNDDVLRYTFNTDSMESGTYDYINVIYSHVTGNAIVGAFVVDDDNKHLYQPLHEYLSTTGQHWNAIYPHTLQYDGMTLSFNENNITCDSGYITLQLDNDLVTHCDSISQFLYYTLHDNYDVIYHDTDDNESYTSTASGGQTSIVNNYYNTSGDTLKTYYTNSKSLSANNTLDTSKSDIEIGTSNLSDSAVSDNTIITDVAVADSVTGSVVDTDGNAQTWGTFAESMQVAINNFNSNCSDIKNVFPFSLITDIKSVFTGLDASAISPVWYLPIHLGNLYNGSIKLSMEKYDNVMVGVRFLECLSFVIVVIMLCKKFFF